MTGGEKSHVAILASTAMSDGFCIAGVDSRNKWFRPIPKGRHNFLKHMLQAGTKTVVEPYNIVEFVTRHPLKNSPHSEDFEIESGVSPTLIRTLGDSELEGLLGQLDGHEAIPPSVPELEDWLMRENRSLTLTRVDKITNAFRNTYSQDTLGQRRIRFKIRGNDFTLACPDLRWRSITRDDKDKDGLEVLTSSRALYFALGLSRVLPATGRCHAMVVGVHPIPRLIGEVDYDNP